MRCARSATPRALLAALALALAGCGVVRPSDAPAVCPSYEDRLRPLVESRCQACHGPSRAEGGYVVGAYLDTMSRRPDGTPRVAPGEQRSPFLQAVRGELAGHAALDATDTARLERWVIDCRASTRELQYHPRGWTTPTDLGAQADGGANFHGQLLRQKFYRLESCQECHGVDLRGGRSGSDCNGCHAGEQGPLSCNTCHGDPDSAAPPRDLDGASATTALGVGAHRAHVVASSTHRAFGCADCHLDVKRPEDEGHYRARGVFQVDRATGRFLPAEVRLASAPGGTAKWDRAAATCTNSTCHAPNPADTAATKKDPVWTQVGGGQLGCGSCHGAPPSNHPPAATECGVCHGASYGPTSVNAATHLDGQVDLKGNGEGCDACHAGPAAPQFVDLLGRTADAGVRTVGAHDAHLKASKLRGPLTCNECHLVPSTLFAPGHVDTASPAEVFPGGFTGIASGRVPMAVYDASNATCATYCHRNGDGPADMTAGLNQAPSWTGGPSQAVCGTCHGLPPLDGTPAHQAATMTTCDTCHAGSVRADGGIVFTALPDGGVSSRHLDGRITGPQ